MSRIACASLLLSIGLLLAMGGAPPAAAQTSGDTAATSGGTTFSSGAGTTTGAGARSSTSTRGAGLASLSDEQSLVETREQSTRTRSGWEPEELPDETYLFLGAMIRALVVPTFIQNLFVSGGETPVNGGFGIMFNYRRNGFNVILEVYYQSFYNEGFYRAASDPETETEFIRSRLGVIMGNIGFGWAFDIADWFAFELGFGIGVGGVMGDLYRQEARRDATGRWERCDNPDPSMVGTGYCESPVEARSSEGRLDNQRRRGGTYQLTYGCNYTRDPMTGEELPPGPGSCPNPHYFGDGGIPPIFFNLDLPRIAFRFKPLHQLQIRLEGAYNIYGFSFGSSVAYGF